MLNNQEEPEQGAAYSFNRVQINTTARPKHNRRNFSLRKLTTGLLLLIVGLMAFIFGLTAGNNSAVSLAASSSSSSSIIGQFASYAANPSAVLTAQQVSQVVGPAIVQITNQQNVSTTPLV